MDTKFKLKGNFFAGKFHTKINSQLKKQGAFLQKLDPGNLQTCLWETPIYYDEIEEVVDSASEGFKQWKKYSLEKRILCLKRYQQQVKKRQEEMSLAIAFETGKPLNESRAEVLSVIAKVEVTINLAQEKITPKFYPDMRPGEKGQVVYNPLGIALIIGPFNFPCHLANGQLVSSLLAGNSIIFRPSEKTLYSAQLLMECLSEAEFPKGVVNFIAGDAEVAQRLVKHKDVKLIHFTGSKEVGKKILAATYSDLTKLVCLELGGKNTTVIHQDTKITESVLEELVQSCFLTTGQRCVSTSIIALHESLYSSFLSQFHQKAKELTIGHPLLDSPAPFMGPLIDQTAVDSYLLFMGIAKREGFEEVMRGKFLERPLQGHYVSPSIHTTSNLSLLEGVFGQSEIFGPNVTVVPYKELEEAINVANGTEYGLACSIFTQEDEVFSTCLENIECGILNRNRSTVGASALLPFGGVKSSGNYRPAASSCLDSCVYPISSLLKGY